jgi:hypothetical protein
MRPSTALGAATLLAAASLFPSPGRAQAFACTADTAGQLSVQASVQCECRWFAANGLRRAPAGYRWDCGILRARANHEVPATANPYLYPLPEALSVENPFILEDGGGLGSR